MCSLLSCSVDHISLYVTNFNYEQSQSERRSLFNIWIYPRIPFWSPAFRDPYQPQRPLYKPEAPIVLEATPPTSDATPPPSATTSSGICIHVTLVS